jgi:hypothetical protein
MGKSIPTIHDRNTFFGSDITVIPVFLVIKILAITKPTFSLVAVIQRYPEPLFGRFIISFVHILPGYVPGDIGLDYITVSAELVTGFPVFDGIFNITDHLIIIGQKIIGAPITIAFSYLFQQEP